MIWVISTGEAFWQHNISRHPKHLKHLTVIYLSFISASPGAKYSRKRRVNFMCAYVRACVYCGTRRFTIFIQRHCDWGN